MVSAVSGLSIRKVTSGSSAVTGDRLSVATTPNAQAAIAGRAGFIVA
jgi:hypothetical protein